MQTEHRKVDPNPPPACQEQVEIKCHLRHEVHGGSNMTTVSFRATGFFFPTRTHYDWKPLNTIKRAAHYGCASH